MRDTIFIELDLNGQKACYRNSVRQILPSEVLSPVRTGDDAVMCMATQEVRDGSPSHLLQIRDREEAVRNVAKEIAEALIDHLQRQDTFNGYSNHDG